MWARSFLLRYEPSGVVGFAYRVTARERVGASTAQVVTVTGYEQLAVVVAGAAAAMAGFLGAGVHPPLLADVLFAAALVTAVAAVVGGSVSGGWLHDRLQARGIETAGPLRGRTLALMVALDAAGWVATGLGAWALARALGASAGLDAPLLLGAFALAWLLGVLVPLAPGGLGLREASLILTLGAAIGAAPATALALALRLVSFAGELVAIAIAELAAVGLARRATTAPAPAPAPRLRPSRTAAAPSSSSRPTARPTPSPAWSSASRRPGSSSSWSTTRPPTGPASWLTRSPPTARGCTSFTAPARTASAWPIARASPGAWSAATASSARWTQTSPTRPRSSPRCSRCSTPREADLVLGNRYMPGGGTAGWSQARRVLSRIGCTGSKLVLGLPFDDLSGGFKLWRASTLAALDFDSMLSTGYAFQVETTQLAYLMGKRIEEVPFVFSERIAGESKMTLAVSLEGIRVTFALRRRARGRGAGLLVT